MFLYTMYDWPPRRSSDDEKALLEEPQSRGSSISGYEALLASERELLYRRRRSLCCNPSTFVISLLVLLLVVESFFLARAYWPAHAGPVPHFATHEAKFERQLDWEFGPEAHDLWAGVIPNSGLVAIHSPEQHGLNPGLYTSAPDAQVYGVVVTHEYHCLRMVRESMVGLVTRSERYMAEMHAANESTVLPQGRLNHLFHCMDYLRQTILCRADTTLEWQSDIDSVHIDGYGPPHQCRNWDEVRAWMADSLPPDPVYTHQLVS